MSDLKKYIEKRKRRDPKFARGYEAGYQRLKIGLMLRMEREAAGLSQEQLARRLRTQKTAISRIENHAEDIKLSTLERFVEAMGKKLEIKISESR